MKEDMNPLALGESSGKLGETSHNKNDLFGKAEQCNMEGLEHTKHKVAVLYDYKHPLAKLKEKENIANGKDPDDGKPNPYFGEIGLITKLKRTANVTALDYCTLSQMNR